MSSDFKQSTNLAGKILASGQITTQIATVVNANGGTWTPSVGGVNATAVAWDCSAATLQTSLRTVNAAITVTGSAGGPYTIICPAGTPQPVALAVNQLTTATTGPGVVMTGVDTTIYTVPASSAVKVATFSISNPSTLPTTIEVSVVPSGGTVDGTHKVVSAFVLAGNDSTKITEVEGAMLDTGAFISVSSSQATALNYLLTGAVAS